MDTSAPEVSGNGSEPEYSSGVRLVVLNLPEDEGEGLGFRLTRTLWDPYPWVREVTPGSRADTAGLKMGDCLLQADGKDLLGLPVGQVAGLIRGDGAGRGVSLLAWNCGVDPKDDPELLWSCGGGLRGERARRALGAAVRALACCVCAATAARPLSCARSHIYCEACWSRLERCALCREPLPAKDSPYARNLVAEQVFEAIATEYEIKNSIRKPRETVSAYTSPNRSPNLSPAVTRKGQYQLSMVNRKKTVQFTEMGQSYGSDPNIHRSLNHELSRQLPKTTNGNKILPTSNTDCQCHLIHRSINQDFAKTTNSKQILSASNTDCHNVPAQIPKIKVEDTESCGSNGNCSSSCQNAVQHKLVTRLRQACSLADLQKAAVQSCHLSKSLNNLCDCKVHSATSSLENLKNIDAPVFLLPAPPIYVVTCNHDNN